jgi:hypothetical protein
LVPAAPLADRSFDHLDVVGKRYLHTGKIRKEQDRAENNKTTKHETSALVEIDHYLAKSMILCSSSREKAIMSVSKFRFGEKHLKAIRGL